MTEVTSYRRIRQKAEYIYCVQKYFLFVNKFSQATLGKIESRLKKKKKKLTFKTHGEKIWKRSRFLKLKNLNEVWNKFTKVYKHDDYSTNILKIYSSSQFNLTLEFQILENLEWKPRYDKLCTHRNAKQQWNESVERSEERYRGQYYLLATRRDGGRYCTNCSDTARPIERFRKRGYNPRRVSPVEIAADDNRIRSHQFHYDRISNFKNKEDYFLPIVPLEIIYSLRSSSYFRDKMIEYVRNNGYNVANRHDEIDTIT